jgi:hypothetical protein
MGPVLATFAITALGVAPTTCSDIARIRVDLQPASIDSGASGEIALRMDSYQSSLRLRVRNLEPESEYILLADGVERARFMTDPRGTAKVKLQYPPSEEGQSLDFDPRGKLLSVSDGSEDTLSAVVSGPLEPPGIRVWEVADIPATESADDGSVRGTYRTLSRGMRVFRIEMRDVARGTYQVLVDEVPVGEVKAKAGGRAAITFWSADSSRGFHRYLWGHGFGHRRSRSTVWAPLDFEPRGAQVEIVRDGEVLFAGPMRAQVALPELVETCPVVDIQTDLTPLQWFGSGDASMVSEDGGCDHEFRVKVRGLAAANYELWVGDAIVGTLPVRNWLDGLSGEIRFDSEPDDPEEHLLDFDPRGRLIEVRRPTSYPNYRLLEALFPTE